MCICLNCNRIRECNIYSIIRISHGERAKRTKIFFYAQSPIITSLTSYSTKDSFLIEWDVSECLSYQDTPGNWIFFENIKKKIPTSQYLFHKFPSYLSYDSCFN
uniref:hypothetical protein n=1 Tax=Phaeostrophion irregulare TaxID=243268 RepID=UPI002E77F5F1|nr:hypothetical protein V2492_pgp065 [Phaeostrophion irregulare]WAM64321.1 hypothetical protein [Phaeostrophion irregulare]